MSLHLVIEAMADPQTLPRIIGCFAQRWITPSRVGMTREGDVMRIEIDASDLPGQEARIIAAKLGANVLVSHVTIMSTPESCHQIG